MLVSLPPDSHGQTLSFTIMQSESREHALSSLVVGPIETAGVGLAAPLGRRVAMTEGVAALEGVAWLPELTHPEIMTASNAIKIAFLNLSPN